MGHIILLPPTLHRIGWKKKTGDPADHISSFVPITAIRKFSCNKCMLWMSN
jgi:hypothetical protein